MCHKTQRDDTDADNTKSDTNLMLNDHFILACLFGDNDASVILYGLESSKFIQQHAIREPEDVPLFCLPFFFEIGCFGLNILWFL